MLGVAGRCWRRKGIASVHLADGVVWLAQLHSYDARGIGSDEHWIKRYLNLTPRWR